MVEYCHTHPCSYYSPRICLISSVFQCLSGRFVNGSTPAHDNSLILPYLDASTNTYYTVNHKDPMSQYKFRPTYGGSWQNDYWGHQTRIALVPDDGRRDIFFSRIKDTMQSTLHQWNSAFTCAAIPHFKSWDFFCRYNHRVEDASPFIRFTVIYNYTFQLDKILGSLGKLYGSITIGFVATEYQKSK